MPPQNDDVVEPRAHRRPPPPTFEDEHDGVDNFTGLFVRATPWMRLKITGCYLKRRWAVGVLAVFAAACVVVPSRLGASDVVALSALLSVAVLYILGDVARGFLFSRDGYSMFPHESFQDVYGLMTAGAGVGGGILSAVAIGALADHPSGWKLMLLVICAIVAVTYPVFNEDAHRIARREERDRRDSSRSTRDLDDYDVLDLGGLDIANGTFRGVAVIALLVAATGAVLQPSGLIQVLLTIAGSGAAGALLSRFVEKSPVYPL